MAKKKHLDDFDDFSGFDDFNFDDLGFDAKPVPDDRNPVSKIAGSFAKGMKDKAHNRDFQKQMLRRALPKDYESGFDAFDEVSGFFRDMTEGVKRELRPGLRDIRDYSRKMFPGKSAFVPESLRNKLNDYLDEDQGIVTSQSQEKEDSAKVGIMLGEIFAEQAKYDEAKSRDQLVRDEVRSLTEKKRFESSYREIVRTNSLLTGMVNYQDKVTTAYRKRMLELQYKSYLTQARTLETLKITNEKTNALLESVVKNTALPDFVKMRNTEAVKELLRRRMINMVIGGADGKVNGLFGKVLGAGAQGAVNLAKNFSNAVSMASGMAGMMGDPFEDEMDSGPKSIRDKMVGAAQMGSELAGGEVMAHYVGKAADKGRDWFGRGGEKSLRRKIMKGGKYVDYYAGNRDQHMQNALRDGGGFFGALASLMGLDKEAYVGDASLTRHLSGLDALGGPGGSEKQRLTIEEVIPGWLGKIWGELRMTRTGESSYEAEGFDFKHRKFVKASQSAAKVANVLFKDGKSDFLNKRSGQLAKEMLGGATVSQEALTALTRKIKMDALEGISPQPEKYRFSLGMPISEKAQEEIRSAIEKHYGYDFDKDAFSKGEEFIDKRRKLMAGYKTVESNISRARNDAIQFMDEGHIQGLRELGLVKETKDGLDFDYNRYFELAEQGVDLSTFNIPPPPPEELKKSKRRKQRRGINATTQTASPTPNAPYGQPSAAVAQSQLLEETVVIRTQSQMQLEVLKEILQKMYIGVPSAGTVPVGDEAGSKPFILDFNHMARRVGDAGKSIFGAAGKLLKGTYWLPTKLPGMAWAAGKSLKDAAKEGGNILKKNVLNPMREKLNKLTDVYFGEEGLPRLTFDGFMARKYYDKTTGKVISKLEDLKDVKEAVVDSTGKVLLSAEEIAKGLKDRHGKKLSALRDGIIQKTKEGIAGGLTALTGMFQGIGDGFRSEGFQDFQSSVYRTGAKGIGGATDLLSRMMGGLPGMVGGAIDGAKNIARGGLGLMGFGSAGVLERIYELLDQRMPGAPGSHLNTFGDTDSDGVRDNSWQDRLARRKARKEKGEEEGDEEGMSKKDLLKKGGFLGGLLSMLGLGGNADADEYGDEEDGFGLDDAADAAILSDAVGGRDKSRRGRKVKGPRGRKSWLKRFAKKPLRTVGGSLLRGAKGVGKTLLSPKPIMAAGRVALMAGGLLGKGALALAMNPIGLAIIAGGTAAYFGYKWYKKNQNFKKNYMLQLRAMHYGFDHENEEHIARMIEMEKLWEPLYKNPGSYKDAFAEPTDEEMLMRFFATLGADPRNQYHTALVAEWWEKRGGPIMTMWFNAVFEHTEQTNLEKLSGENSVSPEINVNILKSLSVTADDPNSPINFPIHPINGEENEAPVGETVTEFYEEVVERAKKSAKEYEKDIKKQAAHADFKKKHQERRDAAAKRMNKRINGKKEVKKTDPMMGVLMAGRNDQAKQNKDLVSHLSQSLSGVLNDDYSKNWVWPIKDGQITSTFGPRMHPVYGEMKPHKGIDIAAPEGTPVMAAQSGVVQVRSYLKGYGNTIYIVHDNGTHTRYAHLAAFADGIEIGTRVHAGQVIGFVGNTGVGTGPHLHFEVRNGTKLDNTVAAIDPIQYVKDANASHQQKMMQDQERAIADGGKDLLDPISASLEGTSTIGATRKTAILPKDQSLVFSEEARRAAEATAQVNKQKSPSPAAVSEIKATLDTEDLLNVGHEQVKGIDGVNAGVGNMTAQQQRTNDQLAELNQKLGAQNAEPMFRAVSSTDPARRSRSNAGGNQAPQQINVTVEMPSGNATARQSNGSSTRVNVAQTTRTSSNQRSL